MDWIERVKSFLRTVSLGIIDDLFGEEEIPVLADEEQARLEALKSLLDELQDELNAVVLQEARLVLLKNQTHSRRVSLEHAIDTALIAGDEWAARGLAAQLVAVKQQADELSQLHREVLASSASLQDAAATLSARLQSLHDQHALLTVQEQDTRLLGQWHTVQRQAHQELEALQEKLAGRESQGLRQRDYLNARRELDERGRYGDKSPR